MTISPEKHTAFLHFIRISIIMKIKNTILRLVHIYRILQSVVLDERTQTRDGGVCDLKGKTLRHLVFV